MQHNIALCKIILHNSPAESPIFRSESTSFKRQPSPSETFADYSQNDKQIQPFMGFAKKSASNRSCRNAPTRTTPRGKRSFGRYARETGQPLRGDRRARRRRRRSPSGNAVVLCATIRMKKPSAKDLRRFSFCSCACGAFAVSSRNRDLTSLRSFYLFCLPQGRYRTCASRCATNGPKRKNRFQATLKRFSLSFLRLRHFRSFEPKPRFELGTPSLRVKCSTAELFL